eukprot:3156054-Alexandrium_andersonii.AAC.1
MRRQHGQSPPRRCGSRDRAAARLASTATAYLTSSPSTATRPEQHSQSRPQALPESGCGMADQDVGARARLLTHEPSAIMWLERHGNIKMLDALDGLDTGRRARVLHDVCGRDLKDPRAYMA